MNSSRAAEQRVRRARRCAARRIADPRDLPRDRGRAASCPSRPGCPPEGVSLAIEQSPRDVAVGCRDRCAVCESSNLRRARTCCSAPTCSSRRTGRWRSRSPLPRRSTFGRLAATRRWSVCSRSPRRGRSTSSTNSHQPEKITSGPTAATIRSRRSAANSLPESSFTLTARASVSRFSLSTGAADEPHPQEYARGVASDVVLFDQRGCLRPPPGRRRRVRERRLTLRRRAREQARVCGASRAPRATLARRNTGRRALSRHSSLRGGSSAGGRRMGRHRRSWRQHHVLPPLPGRLVHVVRTAEPLGFLGPLRPAGDHRGVDQWKQRFIWETGAARFPARD